LVGIAWTRDVDMDFDAEPVDLDGDGRPDTTLTRHIHAPGGILANPEIFGLVATPDDPPGRVGRISRSTGYLGLREPIDREGRPSGQIGMTCFLCHGAASAPSARAPAGARKRGHEPDRGGLAPAAPVLGLPATTFDYGLLLATASVLDDSNAAAVADRRARGFPSGRTVRARLLLAGPGRQDLTGEFGLDVTVPGIHSTRYPGTARLRQGTTGIVNPLSVPSAWGTDGLDVQNWSGSEVASPDWVRRVLALGGVSTTAARANAGAAIVTTTTTTTPREAAQLWSDLGLPGAGTGDAPFSPEPQRDTDTGLRRALLLDLRNLGTLGLQQDSYPALLWADAVRGRAQLAPEALRSIPALYAIAPIRRVLEESAEAWRLGRLQQAPSSSARSRRAAAVARGRQLFSDRVVGQIANLQILREAPGAYAAARLAGPVLAPIDAALPATIPVRCADCHNATPGGGPLVAFERAPPPLGRCSHCHHSHSSLRPLGDPDEACGEDDPRQPLATLGIPSSAPEEVARCRSCHSRHRAFGRVAYSSSAILPFDANQNGMAQDDEVADARAGGIGTEALLAFDVPRPERPAQGFQVALPRLADAHRAGRVGTARLGAGWVRVAPLVAVSATAPYLHNGSVPTLEALLEPAARRPITFALGRAGFVFDTRLPGNRNLGHEFGTRLSAAEKRDLIAFLESL
jgi:hypothetical protein